MAMTGQQIADAAPDGWALLVHYGVFGLHARIHTEHVGAGLQLVIAIGEVAADADHCPELDLRPTWVDVRLTSGYEAGGVTEVDLALAHRISSIAADAGARIESESISLIALGLDTPDQARVGPFWAAVLNASYYSDEGWAEVRDRHRSLPLAWFQRSAGEEHGQRWHPDIFVDPAQVQPRIEAALAAGGTLVSDQGAPTFWVLSDPDGNHVCLTTWQGRD